MVFGLSKEEREERKNQRSLDKAANRIAEQGRREARREGKIKGARKRGYAEGYEQGKKGGGGLIGFLHSASKHIEVGSRKGGQDFNLLGFGDRNGPSSVAANADDFSLGLPGQGRKGKKRNIYDEYGL